MGRLVAPLEGGVDYSLVDKDGVPGFQDLLFFLDPLLDFTLVELIPNHLARW